MTETQLDPNRERLWIDKSNKEDKTTGIDCTSSIVDQIKRREEKELPKQRGESAHRIDDILEGGGG